MNSKKFFALAKENGIEPCELSIIEDSSLNFSLFKKELISYSMNVNKVISARGVFNGKMGSGITEKDDKTTIDYLLTSIKNGALLNESEDEPIIFKGSEKYCKARTFSKELKEWPVEEKLKVLHEIEDKLQAFDPRITDVEVSYSDEEASSQMLNSYGLVLKSKSNSFYISASVVAKDGNETKSNWNIFFSDKPNELDVDKFVEETVSKCLAKFHGETIENGKYKAILTQDCVADLLKALLSNVSSESVQKHSSLFEGKLNTQVASKKLTVYEKPLAKNFFFSAFDGEGVATQNKTVIENGVLKTYFYNLNNAKKDGVESTGNGSKSGNKVGIKFSNIFVKPGRTSFEGLVEKVHDGVFITDITGLHAGLNATSGDFSLQAEGFHIKDGKVDKPLTLITISGNLFKLFNDIIAVGNDTKLLVSATTTPSIAFKNLKISAE